jgi:hypothetical protein
LMWASKACLKPVAFAERTDAQTPGGAPLF